MFFCCSTNNPNRLDKVRFSVLSAFCAALTKANSDQFGRLFQSDPEHRVTSLLKIPSGQDNRRGGGEAVKN